MPDDANKLLTDFLNNLPEHTRGNIAFRVMALLRPDIEFGPETDWKALAIESINPTRTGGGLDPKHGAAVVWAGLLDYAFHRFVPAPTSAEMHQMADSYRDEHGHESTHMRGIAEQQDAVNADFEAAAEKWRELRDGPLSIDALQRAWWNRERTMVHTQRPGYAT